LERGTRPSVDRLGPPPEDQACREGRYNCADESVLYLCSSELGVAREADIICGRELHFLAYRLPLQDLRVADFAGAALDSLFNAVFEIAETFNVEERGPATYSFSQFVAQVVAEAYDGMMVPGVRGDRTLRYANVVIFRPHPRWREWVDQEPRVVRTSVSAAGEEMQ
jgi:hypothetical protein